MVLQAFEDRRIRGMGFDRSLCNTKAKLAIKAERIFTMKNEYKITKKEMMSWAKECHLHGTVNIILFALWCIVGLIGLEWITRCFFFGGGWIDWYFSVLFLFVSIFKLFFSPFVVCAKNYKLYSTTYGVTEWMRTTEFLEDEIVLTDHTSVNKLKYSNIKKIKEKNNIVMIFMNDNIALRLYKDAFVEGSWEECKNKINSMTK